MSDKPATPAPWSVRGVSAEARAKAAKAARRRRMTIGEWVDSALIGAANEELGTGPPRLQETPPGTSPERAVQVEVLDADLAGRVTALVERMEASDQQTRALTELSDKLVEFDKRSGALAAIAKHLEVRERRERAMFVMMHNLTEKSRAYEAKLGNVLDMVTNFVNRAIPWYTPQPQPSPYQAPPTAATAMPGALPAPLAPPAAQPMPGPVPPLAAVAPAGLGSAPEVQAPPGTEPPKEAPKPMKFDFEELNKRAMENAKQAAAAAPRAAEGGMLKRVFKRDQEKAL